MTPVEREPSDWATEDGGSELRPHRVVEGEVAWTHGYERDEHLARTARVRKILIWGALAWLSFLPTDMSFNWLRGESSGVAFVLVRVLTTLPLLGFWYRLGRSPAPTHVALAVGEAASLSLIAVAVAWMALVSGGFASPVIAGVLPILVVRALAIPESWKRGLPVACAPVLAFWASLGAGTLLGSAMMPDDTTIATLCLHLGMQVVTIAMVVAGSHISWDVRRNLYKARTVGRYELLRPLGRGGMSEVWVAWHQSLRQQVAVKILRVGDDPQASVRFEREVAATTKLRHPNTVRVYDFGHTHDGLWYYAMELLEGETLSELVAREGPLPIARALALLRQAARALAEAHRYGIVHRDIKPENLFVSTPAGETDVIKVLDFGVASVGVDVSTLAGATEPLADRADVRESVERERGEEEPTEPGSAKSPPVLAERAVGTPLYLSPEVARGEAASPRSDIYGLGCVLYFMLTGRPPFVERDVAALLRAHISQVPPSPSTLLSVPLPDYVETLLSRCLSKDPAQRYESAEALVAGIDLCLRLGDIDRRRGAGDAQLPRVRSGQREIEAWAKHSRTETDMSLIGSE